MNMWNMKILPNMKISDKKKISVKNKQKGKYA